MFGDNKQIRDVADVAARIMAGLPPLQEKLHPNQQKLDVHEPEKDELTSDDFKKLRAGKKPDVKKEEVEQQDEAMSHQAATTMKHIPNPSPAQKQAAKDMKPGVGGYRDRADMLKSAGVKEDVELDEATMTGITLGQKVKNKQGGYNQDVHHKGEKIGHIEAYKHRTGMRYGSHHDASGDATAGNRDAEESIADIRFSHAQHLKDTKVKKEQVELDEVKMADLPSTKVQGRSYGSSKPQPSAFDILKGPKEKELKSIESEKKKKKMSEMVALYKEGGMKAFFESIKKEDLISEEPDSAQFAKELEDQKAKMDGKMKGGDVAKASVQAVKQEEVEIQVINADLANGVDQVDIEERVMTEPEKQKKEEMVKSMKKGLAGFKERYGDRAKNVMYATATKNAMKD
jgi:hypothetical protein